MQIIRSLDTLQPVPSACALGMFDGVHLGHQMVLAHALRQARLKSLQSVVFSFANHPQEVLSKTPTLLLSSLEERLARFEALGFDRAVIVPFTPALKNLSAQAFVEQVLIGALGARSVSVGYDFRFGADRAGDGAYLAQTGPAQGFESHIVPPVRANDQIISSTLIRKLLSYGEVEQANTLLGYPYTLGGQVVLGLQRGRTLGFPTANLEIEPGRLIPAIGTYNGIAMLANTPYRAVCNVGVCPTFSDIACRRVEVHLLDYPGPNFYGQTLTLQWMHRLRNEQRFADIGALVAQIQEDCDLTRQQIPLGAEHGLSEQNPADVFHPRQLAEG